jgi:hypothetical protein
VLVADRLAGKHIEAIRYEQVISATYSDPEVASVGLTEAKAKERVGKIRVGKFPYAAIGKAAVTGHSEGFIKIVAAEKHDELLGVHIIGSKATELIHEAAVALLSIPLSLGCLVLYRRGPLRPHCPAPDPRLQQPGPPRRSPAGQLPLRGNPRRVDSGGRLRHGRRITGGPTPTP